MKHNTVFEKPLKYFRNFLDMLRRSIMFAKIFILQINLVYSGDPNMDLVLANSGMHLGIDTSLDKRIMTHKPNYNSLFGKDPELERNARSLKAFLTQYKQINNPTMEEWVSIKNLAVAAVRGECKASDKLFEIHVIPRGEYDKLLKRCGRTGIEHGVNNDLQALRIREKAGDSYAHANLEHLRQHNLAGESHYSGMGDALNDSHNHLFGDAGNNMNTGIGLNYGITAADSSKGSMDSLFDEPSIKRSAFSVMGRDFESLKSKLHETCTSFGHEAIDRLNRFKRVAEDVVHEVGGAAEKFAEMQHDNRRFVEAMLGHGGIDEELRNALATGEIDEQIHAISVPLHGHDEHGNFEHSAAEIDDHLHMRDEMASHTEISKENGLDMAANAENAHSAEMRELMTHDAVHRAEMDHKIAEAAHHELVHEIADQTGLSHDAAAHANISDDIQLHKNLHLQDEKRAHEDADLREHAKAYLEAQHREIEAETAGRIEDFARKTYEIAMETGAPKDDAIGYSKQAKALAAEFENNMTAGMGRSESMDKAIVATNNMTGRIVPERIIEAFHNLYAQPYHSDQKAIEMLAKSNNAAFAASPLIQNNLNSVAAGSLSEALKFNRAAEEIAARKNIAEVKIAEAEAKMKAAQEKINESNLTTNAKIALDIQRQKIEDEAKGEIAFNRKQIEILNEKKKRYETILAKNQPKSIKYATSLKDLSDLQKQYDEILQSNKKIVQQENVIREEATKKNISIITPPPDMAMEEINSRHELSAEKKNARMVEESLAREAEEKEIQEARVIAALNVKRLGGSDEDAAKEGEKASTLKRKLIEQAKMDIAKDIKGKLRFQIGDLKAIGEAQHIAMTHNGKNPIGNNVLEVEDHQKNIEMNEEDKQFKKNQPADDRNLVVKLIPDNVSQISADNSVIELPMNGIPTAKAKTIEEENIKKELENLRDEVRNKVTKKNFNSGLVVIKGIEGFMNLPESCKEVNIKKGIVYYDQAGYNFMVSQKLDVTPLVAIYSRGTEPVYYKVEFKDMKMALPTILNTNAQKLLYNEFESINIEFAKRLEIVNGVVVCEPWTIFSSRMRPKVYKGVSKGADEVPDSIKSEFERIESDKDGLKQSDIKIVKNPDGMIMVEIRPQFGITSKMKIGDAVKKANEISKKRIKDKLPQINLNIADEPDVDYTKEFMDSVEKDLVGKKEYKKILNEKNPMTEKTSARIENIKNFPKLEDMIKMNKRPGNNEQVKAYNKLVDNAKAVSSKLKMREKDFLDSISKVDNSTISKMQDYFFDVSSSLDYQKKLSQMDQQDFVPQIKQYFPNQQVSEVVNEFFKAFSEVVRIPNKIEGIPVTNILEVTQTSCCESHIQKCVQKCVKNNKLPVKSAYTVVPIVKGAVFESREKIRVIEPANPIIKPKKSRPKPLTFCKSLKNYGCLLFGNPRGNGSPIMQKDPISKSSSGAPNLSVFTNANNSGIPVQVPQQQIKLRPMYLPIQQKPLRPATPFIQPSAIPGTSMPIQPDNPNTNRPSSPRSNVIMHTITTR